MIPRAWDAVYGWTLPPIAGAQECPEGSTWSDALGRCVVNPGASSPEGDQTRYQFIEQGPNGGPGYFDRVTGNFVPYTYNQPQYVPGGGVGYEPMPYPGMMDSPYSQTGADLLPNPATGTYWQWNARTGRYDIDTGIPVQRSGGGGPAPVPVNIGGAIYYVSPDMAAQLAQSNYQFSNLSAEAQRAFAVQLQQFYGVSGSTAAGIAADLLLHNTVSADTKANLAQQGQQFDQLFGLDVQRFGLEQQRFGLERERFGFDQKRWAQELGFNYDSLAAQIGAGNADRYLQAAIAQGDVATQNALRAFGAAENAKDRTLALAQLQATDQQFRLSQEQSLLGQIGSLAQQPGDLMRYAALVNAPQGQAPISTAVGQGVDLRTEESVFPLAGSLGLLDRLRQPSPYLQGLGGLTQPSFGFPVSLDLNQQALQVPGPSPYWSGMRGGGWSGGGVEANPSPTPTGQPAPAFTPAEGWTDALQAFYNSLLPEQQAAAESGGAFLGYDVNGNPVLKYERTAAPALASGGRTSANVALVGEQGPEIVIDNPDGTLTVVPMNKVQRAQGGGTFAPGNPALQLGTIGSVPRGDIQRAFDYLNQIAQWTLARSPWRDFPTPVGVSAPGTSPYLQQMAASLTSTGRGVPIPEFLREIALAQPMGLSERAIARTA